MLRGLTVSNFRAIGPKAAHVDLAPLTVLVGESGAGKSSFLEALVLTAQSALEAPRHLDLVLDGSCLSIGAVSADEESRYADLHFRRDPAVPMSVRLVVDVADRPAWPGLQIPGNLAPSPAHHWPPAQIAYEWVRTEVSQRAAWRHRFEADGQLLWEHDAAATGQGIVRCQDSAGKPRELASVPPLPRVLGRDLFVRPTFDDADRSLARPVARALEALELIVPFLQERLRRVGFLSALRGTELMNEEVGGQARFVGAHGQDTLRLLASLSGQMHAARSLFDQWLERFGLSQMKAGPTGDRRLNAAFMDRIAGTRLDLRNAAGGARQALILAAQLLVTEPGSILAIEEPEINLHPAYEKLLAELLADAVKLGQQVILSTHSEILVAALAQAVRRDLLSADKLAIWHVERTEAGLEPTRIDVSDRGNLKDWVQSFAKVEQELFDEWVDGCDQEG